MFFGKCKKLTFDEWDQKFFGALFDNANPPIVAMIFANDFKLPGFDIALCYFQSGLNRNCFAWQQFRLDLKVSVLIVRLWEWCLHPFWPKMLTAH